MSRITTTVLIMLVLMNGTVGIMAASGFNDSVGVSIAPGVEEQLDNTVENIEGAFSPAESGATGTLFNLFMGGVSVLVLVVEGTYAAPQMFINMGFPSWIILPFFAPMYIVGTLEIVYVATGRDTI